MRIAFITFEYPPRLFGGAGVYAENIVTNLAKLGHEIEVYVPTTDGPSVTEHLMPGVEINRLSISREWFLGLMGFCAKVTRRLERAKGQARVDVVHINSMAFFGLRDRVNGLNYVSTGHHLSGETARKANLRLVDRLQDFNGENGFLVPWAERYGVRFTDRYIAVSMETKLSLRSLYGVSDQQVDVVWNGVDVRGAPIGPQDREELRTSLGLPSEPIFLFVGRIDDPRKDLLSIIRALAKLPMGTKAHLVVVGSGNTTKAEQLAKDLGEEERVIFRGRVSPEELWKTYLVADTVICASKQEGFGLTILEGLCSGCKVISTEVGVVKEIKDRLEAIVPVSSPEALAEAMARTTKHPSKSRYVEVKLPYDLSWERSVHQTVSAYEKVIEERRNRDDST